MKNILNEELNKIKEKDLFRRMRTVSSSPDKEIVIDGKTYCNFSSNNYLSLATHPAVKRAAVEAIEKYGCGGTASRLVAGTLEVHQQLEQELAAFKQTEAALVFSTGYQANLGAISALVREGDCLIMDRLNHASLWDGVKLTKARVFVYPHRDMDALEKLLVRAKEYRRRIVVTDSVFSMDGDFAPLKDIVFLAKKHGAWTMVDEAHATGIFGERGSGLAEQCGVEKDVDIIVGTLSKALGSQGGFVCGSKELIEYLVNCSRSFIYSTSLAPAPAAAARAAIALVRKEPQRRKALLERSQNFRLKLQAVGFNTAQSESQIIPFLVGPATETVSLSAKLWHDGIFAPAIRPPTVPENECRLRFSLTADHTQEDINKLLESIIG